MYYIFADDAFKHLADICEEYDFIADSNEISLPYIAYVYGKSKTHLIRITGCLWVLEIAFKILSQIETIPDNKDLFVNAVIEKFSKIENRNVITVQVVEMAAIVMKYFIDHKLILSDLERDTSSQDVKFIKRGLNKNGLSNNLIASSSKKGSQTLEQRVLLTAGSTVFLTPLSKAKYATNESFSKSCKLLEEKGLGEYGSFLPSKDSTRSAKGFKKTPVPPAGCKNEVAFINALLDFGCSLDEYSSTLLQDIIPPPPTPGNTRKNNPKRLSKETSLNDMTNISKIPKHTDIESESSDNE